MKIRRENELLYSMKFTDDEIKKLTEFCRANRMSIETFLTIELGHGLQKVNVHL